MDHNPKLTIPMVGHVQKCITSDEEKDGGNTSVFKTIRGEGQREGRPAVAERDAGVCYAWPDLGVDGDDEGGVPGQVAAARLRVLLQQAVHVPQQLHHPLIPRACTSQHSLVRRC